MTDIISMQDFSKEDILKILNLSADVKKAIHDHYFNKNMFKKRYGSKVNDLLHGTKIASLFIENSTRTNFSFRAAAGTAKAFVDGFPTQDYTSLKKGETWADTAAMFAGYGYDAIVMRSTTEGLPRWTKEFLSKNNSHLAEQHKTFNLPFKYKSPAIINGGDGKNQHPTQCFLDLFTMKEVAEGHNKSLDYLDIALLNDLAHGRTNASLMSVAHLFNFKLHLAYPPRFGPQKHRLEQLLNKGVEINDYKEDFFSAMENSFIAYHSRPQKERVGKGEDLITIKNIGQIDKKLYEKLGNNAPYLMHPLPVDSETFEEISPDINFHPKNITKWQSSNGLYVRIALLAISTGKINLYLNSNNLSDKVNKLYLDTLKLTKDRKELKNPRSGYIEENGIVLDHLPAGMGRRLSGVLGLEQESIPKSLSDYIPVSSGKEKIKDMIKIHAEYNFSEEQLQAIALIAPETTISYVKNGKVITKIRPSLGEIIFGRIKCKNESCVTNVKKEPITSKHFLENTKSQLNIECGYCEQTDTIEEIYKDNRFIYIGEE